MLLPDLWQLNQGFLFKIRPISRCWSFLCSLVRLESGFSLIFRLVLHWLFSVTLPFNGSCPTPALSASGLRESCLAKKHTGMRKNFSQAVKRTLSDGGIVFANGQGYCFSQESVGLKGSSQGSFQGKDSFESTDSVHPNGRVPIDGSSRGALASLSLQWTEFVLWDSFHRQKESLTDWQRK